MIALAIEQLEVQVGAADENRARLVRRAGEALTHGADVVIFPELAVSGYTTDGDVVQRVAEPLDGPTVEQLMAVTAESGGLVVTGLCERSGKSFFNSVVAVGADGPALHYRKLHLFDREREVYEPGDLGLPVLDTPWGRMGACICYDLRFVEVLRLLSLRGADLVVAPAAWVAGFDPSVPAIGLTRQAEAVVVQANLDQVAVAAVSQAGGGADGSSAMLGGSLVVDAYGDVVAGPLSRTAPGSTVAHLDIDAGRAARVRSARIRPREDRRTDVYGFRDEELVR
jgi:N-carbamoylputrescine amidase